VSHRIDRLLRALGPTQPLHVDGNGRPVVLGEPDVIDGMWLRTARTASRLTQLELADRLGLNVMTISRWERGVYAIPHWQQPALRALFGGG
jgi:hypothetical protein